MTELWADIEGYPNYQISNMGRLRRLEHTSIYNNRFGNGKSVRHFNEKIYDTFTLTGGKSDYKYYGTALTNDEGQKHIFIHRLVALAFIPNPDNLPEVDHIDNNPLNNRVDNLRWVTRTENNRNRVFKPREPKVPKVSKPKREPKKRGRKPGCKLSEEHKKKLSEAKKGKPSPNKGKKYTHTEAYLAKHSKSE